MPPPGARPGAGCRGCVRGGGPGVEPGPGAARTCRRLARVPAFTVEETRLLEGGRSGNLRASAPVRVGPLLVAHKFRVVEQPGRQRAWVAPPQKSWEEPAGGGTRYRALLEIPDAWKQPLSAAVLARYAGALLRKGGAA